MNATPFLILISAIACQTSTDTDIVDTDAGETYVANSMPVAYNDSISTPEETPVSFTLTGSDPDGDELEFIIDGSPAFGDLTGTPPELTYRPDENFTGSDSLLFVVYDGERYSSSATFTLSVTGTDDAPTVPELTQVLGKEDQSVSFTLTGSDSDGDMLTYNVISAPTRGTLSGTAPGLTYTPEPDMNGIALLTYEATDGTSFSDPGTVEIQIEPVNDPPTIEAQSFIIDEDQTIEITAIGYDPDGDVLEYSIGFGAANGNLVGTPPTIFYDPDSDYHGDDQFAFQVTDGILSSGFGIVSITLNPINDAPDTTNQMITLDAGSSKTVTVYAFDAEGDPVSYQLAESPDHGTLVGTLPTVTYTPDSGYTGQDRFRWTASDGVATSGEAWVDFLVE
jgi:hypothetical protein